MRKYAAIAVGGFAGAILRYILKGISLGAYHGHFPVNTLLINVAGAFLLGFILTAAAEAPRFDEAYKLGLTVGFLGAFTTFSTMCREIFGLLATGGYRAAIVYMAGSIALGLTAAGLGALLARKTVPALLSQKEEGEVE